MELPISFVKLCFYGFAFIAIASALMVVTSRNSVRAVLFLVLTFVGASGLWMLTQAEYLALTLILVYVGAVMVLFLFVVMMLNMNTAPLKEGFVKYLPVGILVTAVLIGQLIWVFKHNRALVFNDKMIEMPADYSSVHQLGMALYTDYLYPFEIAGVILLVAIIAAIALAFRGPRDRRKQNIAKQVRVQKSERLHIIKDVSPNSSVNPKGESC